MNRFNLTTKRQLLTDLFEGKADGIWTYQISRQRNHSPYRWIIIDEIARTVYGIGQDGSQHSLTTNDIANVPLNMTWRIRDFSGGLLLPDIDE